MKKVLKTTDNDTRWWFTNDRH